MLNDIFNWPDGFGLDIQYSSKMQSNNSDLSLFNLSLQPMSPESKRRSSAQVMIAITDLQVNLQILNIRSILKLDQLEAPRPKMYLI